MRHLFGPILLILALVACTPAAARIDVPVSVTAGPSCAVERDPPDPSCADRPVSGAELLILGADGRQVASVRTDAEGHATLSLPAGSYVVRPQAVVGLMGTAPETELEVAAGTPEPLVVSYDTGIR